MQQMINTWVILLGPTINFIWILVLVFAIDPFDVLSDQIETCSSLFPDNILHISVRLVVPEIWLSREEIKK